MKSIDSSDADAPTRASDITLAQLRYFVRAAELHSMSRAAESLFIAQSAVSTAIGNLEQTLGVALFVRHRAKGLSVTPEGDLYLRRVRKALRDLEDAGQEINPTGFSGTYDIGCYPTLIPFWMPAVISTIREWHPQLRPRIREVGHNEVERRLRDREIEVVLGYDFPRAGDLEFHGLTTVAAHAVVAADHPLADRESVSLRELAESTPFGLLDLPGSRDYFREVHQEAGAVFDPAYRLSNYESVRTMVARGHCYSVLNQVPATDETYYGRSVRTIPIVESVPGLGVGVVTVKGEVLTRKGGLALEAFRARAGDITPQ